MAARKGRNALRSDHMSVNRAKKKDLDAELQAFLNDESTFGKFLTLLIYIYLILLHMGDLMPYNLNLPTSNMYLKYETPIGKRKA